MRESSRFLLLIVATLHMMSCVPPSCYSRVYGTSSRQMKLYARVEVYAEPVEEPRKGTSEMPVGIWERFKRRASIDIEEKGRMAVFGLSSWPERCPRIPQDELAEASQHWQLFLERPIGDRTLLQVMAIPYTGDDWRAVGPLLYLEFGSASGRSVGLLWDYQSSLPEELDTVVIGTLELACSNSRLAKKYLLRDLPPQVGSRLECSSD